MHVKYERDYKLANCLQPNKVWSTYGEFVDKLCYNGQIPTAKYLAYIYKPYNKIIRNYLDKEVKKRGA